MWQTKFCLIFGSLVLSLLTSAQAQEIEEMTITWRAPISPLADGRAGTNPPKTYDITFKAAGSNGENLRWRFLLEEVQNTKYDYEYRVRLISPDEVIPTAYIQPELTKTIANTHGSMEIDLRELWEAAQKNQTTTKFNPAQFWTKNALDGEINLPQKLEYRMLDPASYLFSAFGFGVPMALFVLPDILGPLLKKLTNYRPPSFKQIFNMPTEQLLIEVDKLIHAMPELGKVLLQNSPIVAAYTVFIFGPIFLPPYLLRYRFGLNLLSRLNRMSLPKKFATIALTSTGLTTATFFCASAISTLAQEVLSLK